MLLDTLATPFQIFLGSKTRTKNRESYVISPQKYSFQPSLKFQHLIFSNSQVYCFCHVSRLWSADPLLKRFQNHALSWLSVWQQWPVLEELVVFLADRPTYCLILILSIFSLSFEQYNTIWTIPKHLYICQWSEEETGRILLFSCLPFLETWLCGMPGPMPEWPPSNYF